MGIDGVDARNRDRGNEKMSRIIEDFEAEVHDASNDLGVAQDTLVQAKTTLHLAELQVVRAEDASQRAKQGLDRAIKKAGESAWEAYHAEKDCENDV